MRKSYLKKVATKSFVGRVLRRLLGEEKGTVMMEYIVVGLLIAAAAVLAVSAFGGYASDLFAALGHAMGGNATASETALTNADATFKANTTASNSHANKVHDSSISEAAVTDASRGK